MIELAFSLDNVKWIQRYPVDSLQIYFPASLEIQEELINHGFYVPRSLDRKVLAPVPLIYSNFRGWLKQPEPITIERLIPPEWLGLTPSELGWKKTVKDSREAYMLPEEEVYLNLGILGSSIVFDLDIKRYHLERISIRGVNPDKWTNWVMFYISLDYVNELISVLEEHLVETRQSLFGLLVPSSVSKPVREVQQGGKEVTYYVRVRVKDFSFCLGCFDLALLYLYKKAKEHCRIKPFSEICLNPNAVVEKLKLRIKYSPEVNTFAKVGIAKVRGKRPQIMVKLASTSPKKVIQGVLKPRIEGKARGILVKCDHKLKKQFIVLDLVDFYNALVVTRGYADRLPKED